MVWQNKLLAYRDPKDGKPYSKSNLKTIHNQLSAIFNHAVRYYKLSENPARTVGNMGSEKGIEMKCWTREEYLKFSEYMMDDPVGYYYFQMLYWCGLREGEALALTISDFDFAKKTVSITKTFQHLKGKDVITEPKTPKSNRIVEMPAFLVQDFRRLIYYVVETAARHGECDNVLWESNLNPEATTESEEVKANQALLCKSLTIPQERAVATALLSDPMQSGQNMGLLLMYSLGLRNAEACAVDYGDIKPMKTYPDCPVKNTIRLAKSCLSAIRKAAAQVAPSQSMIWCWWPVTGRSWTKRNLQCL